MRSLSTLLLFCLLCPWSYADQRSEVEAFQLENGMGVLLKPTEQRRHVSIRLVVGVGFADFSCREKQLPHLLEHLFFSGLDGGDEADLEARMQALGGQWNAYTSEGDTTFVIEAPAATQRQVLDLLLDTITRTELDEPRIAAAKRVIEREGGGHYSHLQRWLDRENLGRGAMDQLAVELGLACSQRAPLAPLSAEQLERLRSDWYVPGNMTLIMVGDLDPRLPAYLTRTFGALQDQEVPERRELPAANGHAEARRTLLTRLFGEGAMLHWIFPEPDDADPDAMVLLQAYMNDALYADLRVRRGLTYGPSTDRQVFANQGFFSLDADVERGDLPATEAALRELLDGIRQHGLDPGRFKRVQYAERARLAWSTQGNAALADYYWGSLADYEEGHFPDEERRLAKVRKQQVDTLAQRLFDGEGYLRIEKPLFDDDMLYPLLLAAACWPAACSGSACAAARLSALQGQAVDDLGRVVRIALADEAQCAAEIAHRPVGRRIHRVHLAEAVAPRHIDQVAHQHGVQPEALVIVGDGHRAFALPFLAAGGVAADADLAQLAVLVHQGDEGHALLVVDIHQLVEQRRTGFLDLAEEAEVAGRRGQPVDELAFTLPVLLAQGTDQHVAAIVEGLEPSGRPPPPRTQKTGWHFCTLDMMRSP
ncbi:putative metalloprotease [Pseudomonas aeruginosa]|nr:putative metalloprotease [Pseudomonas aeruginosa]